MAFRRISLILSLLVCLLAGYTAVHVTMERVARWVEIDQRGYLWWSEEWLQLFTPTNFVNRGQGRILLSGRSEAREGFLFDEFEAELPGFEVYQNSYSTSTMGVFLVVLRYIEAVYGPSAMPDKIVLGVAPRFTLNYPAVEESHILPAINRYSPYVSVDLGSYPPRLVPKGRLESLLSRYNLLTHQSRRYWGALRGVFRALVLAVRPDWAGRYWLRYQLVPSMYHHRPPRPSKQWQIDRALSQPHPTADPSGKETIIRSEFAMLADMAARHQIDLYVVLLPASEMDAR